MRIKKLSAKFRFSFQKDGEKEDTELNIQIRCTMEEARQITSLVAEYISKKTD